MIFVKGGRETEEENEKERERERGVATTTKSSIKHLKYNILSALPSYKLNS